MASTSETGHAKNVANFEKLIIFVEGYGTTYNPTQTLIKLTELQKVHAKAQTDLKNLYTTSETLTPAINARQIAFEPLSKLTTRTVSALDASGATDKTVADAKTYARKIKGERAESTSASASRTNAPAPLT